MNMRQIRPTTRSNHAKRPVPHDSRGQIVPGRSARQSYEHYLTLARAKAMAGDQIEAERCYQYAEHYLRSMDSSAA